MIVLKFGGTSLQDAACIARAGEIVRMQRQKHRVVVVSAIAKATATLKGAGELCAQGERDAAGEQVAALLNVHRDLVGKLGVGQAELTILDELDAFGREIAVILDSVHTLREFSPKTADLVMSDGERMSSRLVAGAWVAQGLPTTLCDAFQIVITDARWGRARPDRQLLRERVHAHLLPAVQDGKIPVVAGFIGATPDGTPTTMGFEASDYTGSLLAAALPAEELQIWTDVSGILTADNRVVDTARTIPTLCFSEAEELAELGAKVIHPETVRPLADTEIPIRIRNSREPAEPETTLTPWSQETPPALHTIALHRGVSLLRVCLGPNGVKQETFHAFVMEALARYGVEVKLATLREREMAVVTMSDTLPPKARQELEGFSTLVERGGLAIVSVIGSDLREIDNLMSRVFTHTEGVAPWLTAFGASPMSLSLVVDEESAVDLVNALHDGLMEGRGASTGMSGPPLEASGASTGEER